MGTKKWQFVFFVFLLLCSALKAQRISGLLPPIDLDSIKRNYPFVRTDLSQLELYELDMTFNALFEKIYRIQEGSEEQLHIVHIGGSHVQAGILSDRLRQRFRSLFSMSQVGERGFLFPYSLAGTNNPYDYTIEFDGEWQGCRNAVRSAECNWGLAGIVASTFQPYSSVKLEAKDPILGRSTFCSARVYYNMDSSVYRLKVLNWDCPVYEEIDSIGGFVEWHFESEQVEIVFMLEPLADSIQGAFVLEGMQLMSAYGGSALHAIGVNGASVPSYLRCEKFAQQLCLLQPDLIIWGIGVNDANTTQKDFKPTRFEDNYDLLLDRVCSCEKEPAMLFLTNNDTFYRKRYANKNALEVREVMRRLAMRHGGGVYDIFGVMGGLQSIQKWQQAGLAKKDLIHFTNDGYRLLGDLIFDAFARRYYGYIEYINEQNE